MFIVSKRSYAVRLSNGSFYRIPKDFIGEIPEEVAESRLVQRAVRSGSIAVPSGTRDRELLEADQKAEELLKENDIRPDAGEEAGGPETTGWEPCSRPQKQPRPMCRSQGSAAPIRRICSGRIFHSSLSGCRRIQREAGKL